MKKIFLILIIFVGNASLKAQTNKCGTKAGDNPVLITKEQQDNINKILAINQPFGIRLWVTVFADDNGTNRAASDDDIKRQIQNMANQYQAHNICFMLMGITQVNNSDLNAQLITDDATDESAEITPFIVSGHLNIFVHTSLPGLEGIAYQIPNTYLSMRGGAFTYTSAIAILGHEVGHCLGLYHTFETFNNSRKENVTRSGSCKNCLTNGDLLCDTPADDNGGVNASCVYIGTGKDVCNTSYSPMINNIMGYGNYDCLNTLTTEQGVKMRSTLISNSSLSTLITQDVSYFPESAGIIYATNFGFSFRTARDELYINNFSNNQYQISGTANHIIQSKKVYLKAGTHFFPSSGKVAIKANPFCN